jgi:PAS domain S-box-containing protein
MNDTQYPCEMRPELSEPGDVLALEEDRGPADGSARRQQAVVALGRRAIAPPPLPILMQDAAALIARMTNTQGSAVGEVSDDGRSIALQVTWGDGKEEAPESVAEQVPIDPGQSLAGYVLQVGHPVRSENLAAETRFEDLTLRRLGVKTALAVPLRLESQAFGALMACGTQRQRYTEADALFAETIAHLVSTTIARRRVEKATDYDRRLASGVLETVGAIVLVLDDKGFICDANRACQRLTGFSRAELVGRPIGNVFPVPQEASLFSRIFDKLRRGISPVEYESQLLTKHSQKRQIAWSYAALTRADGSLDFVLATGLDVTEQRESEARAERAERARQRLAEQLAASGNEPIDPAEAAGVAEASAAAGPFAPLGSAGGRERRKRPRRSFPYRQRVAPIVDGELPRPEQFVEIDCKDIGVGGFSYVAPAPPQSESLVVELGNPPEVTRMIAQIAHVTRVELDGTKQYLIGCSYSGRVM